MNHVYSPVEGKLYPITEVKDEVFANKLIGDGFAVYPSSNLICAPMDGAISMIFPTGHAFGIDSRNGISLLVHIGIETVNEEGKGFEILKEQGDIVNRGDPIVKVDLDYLKMKYDTSIVVIVTNENELSNLTINIDGNPNEPVVCYE